jgi:hypothetical protein
MTMSRRERQRQRAEALEHLEQHTLDRWLKHIGRTRDELIAATDRSFTGVNPAEGMGLDMNVADQFRVSEITYQGAHVRVFRAMQTLSIRRHTELQCLKEPGQQLRLDL